MHPSWVVLAVEVFACTHIGTSSLELAASGELQWDWAARSCVFTATASPHTLPTPLPAAVQLHVGWKLCPRAAAREQRVGGNSGSVGTASSCPSLVQLLAAWSQSRQRHRKSSPAPQVGSSAFMC